MRKQTRPDPPEEFRQNADKWNRQWAELRTRNPSAGFHWYETAGRTAREIALPALKEMTQDHCAFCDVFPLDDRSREPVEHFKPKSRPEFYDQAYTWENLYYCCEFCQGSKGEKWNDQFPPLRPDAAEYSFSRYFRFEFTTGRIEPNPLLKNSEPDAWQQARVTIELYGLDEPAKRRRRLQELRKWSRSSGPVLNEFAYRDFLEGAPLFPSGA